MKSTFFDCEKTYLNLACGDFYVSTQNWINLDWHPNSDKVMKADLSKRLAFPDNFFDCIYTSHFLEHVPKSQSASLLGECYRVLKPNGQIRIVVPDFENIVREYIRNIDNGDLERAEFNVIELIDQCVRQKSGGSLSQWRSREDLTPTMKEYITNRTGYQFKEGQAKSTSKGRRNNFKFLKLRVNHFSKIYSSLVIKTLPRWFVDNHVNFTNTGELHRWVYDFNAMKKLLIEVGFCNVQKLSVWESSIPNFPLYPLDIDELGRSRKGDESIYIEALK